MPRSPSRVQRYGGTDERFQGHLVDRRAFADVDGTPDSTLPALAANVITST